MADESDSEHVDQVYRIDAVPRSGADTIWIYLAEIARVPLLSYEEDKKLSESIRDARLDVRRSSLNSRKVVERVAELLQELGQGPSLVNVSPRETF